MENTIYFPYGKEEIDWLKSKDAKLAEAIEAIGMVQRPVIPDLFMALVNSIVGQQISTKAHQTIWIRMQQNCHPVTPGHFSKIPLEQLQQCGISMRKAVYIQQAAIAIDSGELDLQALHGMPDNEVCSQLCRLKGVGVWTAEMLMTFSMKRMDIISFHDLAILRGMRMLYRHREITPSLFAKYKRRYSPYATVASLYLWEIAGGRAGSYSDPAAKAKK